MSGIQMLGESPSGRFNPKWVDWPELLAMRSEARERNQVVVWTNGCFDLLHVGHVRSLQAARRLGDMLVVGLNSDDCKRQLKTVAPGGVPIGG